MRSINRKHQYGFAAITIGILAGTVHASLPVWGGPTYSPASGGVNGQDQSSLEGISGVSDAGLAIGNGSFSNANNEYVCAQSFRFAPGGATSLLGNLGTAPSGSTLGGVYSISRYGIVVGNRQRFDASHIEKGNVALRYNAFSSLATELGSLGTSADGSADSIALDVNDSGVAVGNSSKYNASHVSMGSRAVRWVPNSTTPTEMQTLGTTAAGGTFAIAYAVNNNGVSTGRVRKFTNNVEQGERAVRWSPTGVITELGVISSLNGITDAEGHDINDAGAVIGSCLRYAANGDDLGERAVLWQPNSVLAVELGNLGTSTTNATSSSARHINAGGTIVGSASRYDVSGNPQGFRAVTWSTSNPGVAVELPALATPSGYTSATAMDVNDQNYVVGYSMVTLNGYHAALWTPAGVAIDLNSFIDPSSGFELIEAKTITETGFISGEGRFDPDGVGGVQPYERVFTILVPQAGTYGRGDVNFDRAVNFDDLLLLSQHYNEANPTKNVNVGDVDLNGSVNFDDLLVLAQNYGMSAALTVEISGNESFAADWALARSLVPEPGSALFVLVGAFGHHNRRNR